jgi:hypothetical protein
LLTSRRGCRSSRRNQPQPPSPQALPASFLIVDFVVFAVFVVVFLTGVAVAVVGAAAVVAGAFVGAAEPLFVGASDDVLVGASFGLSAAPFAALASAGASAFSLAEPTYRRPAAQACSLVLAMRHNQRALRLFPRRRGFRRSTSRSSRTPLTNVALLERADHGRVWISRGRSNPRFLQLEKGALTSRSCGSAATAFCAAFAWRAACRAANAEATRVSDAFS